MLCHSSQCHHCLFFFLFIKYDIFSLIFQVIEKELSKTKQLNETQENLIRDANNQTKITKLKKTKITNTGNTSKVNLTFDSLILRFKMQNYDWDLPHSVTLRTFPLADRYAQFQHFQNTR